MKKLSCSGVADVDVELLKHEGSEKHSEKKWELSDLDLGTGSFLEQKI